MNPRLLIVAALGAALSGGAQQQPVFRTDRTAVIVDVGVLKGRRPVPGLEARHFAISDSGVRQQILDVARVNVPVDISLLLDTSASMDGGTGHVAGGSRHLPARDWVRAGMKSVAASLTAEDRLQVMPFATAIREVPALPEGLVAAGTSGHVGVSGRTALFDAVLAAVMQPAVAGRRHVVVVLTDGTDTASAVPEKLRSLVLDRSDATVYLIACGDRDHRVYQKITKATLAWNEPFGGYDWILKDVAERTGGGFYASEAAGDFAQALTDALAEMRARYLISFQPQGVSSTGWHPLQVTLPGHSGVEIKARKGYYAR